MSISELHPASASGAAPGTATGPPPVVRARAPGAPAGTCATALGTGVVRVLRAVNSNGPTPPSVVLSRECAASTQRNRVPERARSLVSRVRVLAR